MQTKLSTKGQVVLPSPIRRRLGLQSGDPLDAKVEGHRIVLTPRKPRSQKVKIVDDPLTGLPVLSAGPKSPHLTSKQVEEILVSFP
jgi:AbrB family looped-hinge helix DNA binding protein